MQTILIVDDDIAIRSLYTTELEEEGFQAVAAENCTEALHILGKKKVDLVTLDIQIERENGIDLLQKILRRCPGLPIVICSAHNYYKNDYATWRAKEYIVKSSDLKQLKTAVKRILDKNSLDHYQKREPRHPKFSSKYSDI